MISNNFDCDTRKLNQSKLYRAALAYSTRFGWQVLPLHTIKNNRCTCGKPNCHSPGKHPLTQHGVKDATNNPAIIEKNWQRWPWANIGLATGEGSGVFALDVDGETGEESLSGLVASNGALPNTVEQLTGGGGRHVLFKHPGYTVPNKVKLAPKLDTRGDGGYIVVAPSLHISGQCYTWEISSRPGEVAIAPAPAWLLDMLKPSSAGLSRSIEDWRKLVNQGVPEGQRNASVASLAGMLFRKYVDPYVVLDLVLAWNRARCFPPLTDDEVANTVDSVANLEAKRREAGR